MSKFKFNPEIIVHCAGSGSVGLSFVNKTKDFQKNVITSKSVVNYIERLEKKPRVIFFSSAAVYGNFCGLKKKISPISPYGLNKYKSEKIFEKSSKKYNYELQILRFFSIYGEGLRKQLIWDTFNKVNQSKNNFFGSGDEIRSWIHISDVCNLVRIIVNKPIKKNYILDVSGPDILKNNILIKKIFRLLENKSIPYFNKIKKRGDPFRQIYYKKKINDINWSPIVKIDKGLKKYSLWFKKLKI